jgi:hypothetical protein
MPSIRESVLRSENIENERDLDRRVRLSSGRGNDELLVTIDDEPIASVALTPQRSGGSRYER